MLERQDYVELVLKLVKLCEKGKVDKFALEQYQRMIDLTAQELNLKTEHPLALLELFDLAEKNHLDLKSVEDVYSMLKNLVELANNN